MFKVSQDDGTGGARKNQGHSGTGFLKTFISDGGDGDGGGGCAFLVT